MIIPLSLSGKIALVTGANGGLGTQVTRTLIEAGAKVVGLSKHIQQSDFDHPSFTAVAADISTAEAAKQPHLFAAIWHATAS